MKNKKCKMTPADPLPPKWNFPLFSFFKAFPFSKSIIFYDHTSNYLLTLTEIGETFPEEGGVLFL